MNFLNKINILCNNYDEEKCCLKDNAFLYGVFNSPPPLAKHIIFSPLPETTLLCITENYKCTFPTELLTIYQKMNGANLYWSIHQIGKKVCIPINYLSIYGIPRTNDRNCIEPFNISIEDLNRPNGTPDSWLKFGSYYRPENVFNRFDLFIDTNLSKVYSIEHNNPDCRIIETWDSIDSCLCHIFDLLSQS